MKWIQAVLNCKKFFDQAILSQNRRFNRIVKKQQNPKKRGETQGDKLMERYTDAYKEIL